MTFENEIQARDYLKTTDFYFTADKYAQLTPERRAELEAERETARQFIRTVLGEKTKEQ